MRAALTFLICTSSCVYGCLKSIGVEALDKGAGARTPVIHGNLAVFSQQEHGALHHFWESTGFCPPEPHQNASSWFLSQDMQHNLAFMGALPYQGISQVRIHWLLDTVTISRYSGGVPVYNFTSLDAVLDLLRTNGLKPGFEIMGNPSNYFTDFENRTQVTLWRNLVQAIATRYIGRYGHDCVSSWNFETWNEPRPNGDFDTLNFTLQGFLNYYDACSEGLRAANEDLTFGGPGGECHDYSRTSYCWAMLNHTQHGTNYFTGEKGVRIDYVAFHKKGAEPNNTATILAKEQTTYDVMVQNLPSLAQWPIFNDEGDPLVTWSRDRWWRADTTYAAMVVKIIDAHLRKWKTNVANVMNFQLLSNDNGFLSYNPLFFTQRTLLARFQVNTTYPPHVQFIRKPVYTVMGLLALLGETLIETEFTRTIGRSDELPMDAIGAIGTTHKPTGSQRDGWSQTVLVYASDDTSNRTAEVSFHIRPLLDGGHNGTADLAIAAFLLDNERTNPYKAWTRVGKPPTPSPQQFADMRGAEGPVRFLGPMQFPDYDESHQWLLPLPGVVLIHICQKPQLPPGKVTGLRIMNITHAQILLVWNDDLVETKCIKTYEVERAGQPDGPYRRVNDRDEIFGSFVYSPQVQDTPDPSVGYYRVRAVDYFGRPGEYSDAVHYGTND